MGVIWLIPVATGNHQRRALRNRRPHVHGDLGAATTVAHPRSLELVLLVLHPRSANENAPEPAQRLADMKVEHVSAKETSHGVDDVVDGCKIEDGAGGMTMVSRRSRVHHWPVASRGT